MIPNGHDDRTDGTTNQRGDARPVGPGLDPGAPDPGSPIDPNYAPVDPSYQPPPPSAPPPPFVPPQPATAPPELSAPMSATESEGHRRRRRLVIGTAAVVVVGAVVAVVVAAGTGGNESDGTGGGAHTLTLPAAVDGLTREASQTADRLVEEMRSQMIAAAGDPAYTSVFKRALIGIYKQTAGPVGRRLILVGFFADQGPDMRDAIAQSPPDVTVDSILLGANVPDSKSYPTGPRGGALHCGTVSTGTVSVPACAWADSSTVAMVLDAVESTADEAAVTTLAIRAVAEH